VHRLSTLASRTLRPLILSALVAAACASHPSHSYAQTPAADTVPPAQPQAATPQDMNAQPIIPDASPSPGSKVDVSPLNLPRDLSPWSMFASADIVVKAVIVGLIFASVVTWTVWLAKSLELMAARLRLRRALEALSKERSLASAHAHGKGRGVVPSLLNAAAVELQMSSDLSDKSGIKERIAARFTRIESAAARNMNRGTGLLATIGSTAPFVGLFGTVWGIMNSFIGISKSHTTNLAIVAPGIAEALLATAVGLFAAIPAVIIYNQFARSIAGYKALSADASTEVMGIVSRDLDRGQARIGLAKAAE
jgi:biopolymer transport protein ExbB